MMLFYILLNLLGLIPRNATSIFFATDLQIKKIFKICESVADISLIPGEMPRGCLLFL